MSVCDDHNFGGKREGSDQSILIMASTLVKTVIKMIPYLSKIPIDCIRVMMLF